MTTQLLCFNFLTLTLFLSQTGNYCEPYLRNLLKYNHEHLVIVILCHNYSLFIIIHKMLELIIFPAVVLRKTVNK